MMDVHQEQLKRDILDYFSIHRGTPGLSVKKVKKYLRSKYSAKLEISSKFIKQLATQFAEPQASQAVHSTLIPTNIANKSIRKPSKKINNSRISTQNPSNLMMECFGSPLKSFSNPQTRELSTKKQVDNMRYDPTPESLAAVVCASSATNDNDSVSAPNEYKCQKCANIFEAITTKLRKYYIFANVLNYNHHEAQHQMHVYNPYFCFICRQFRCNATQPLIEHLQRNHNITCNKQWKKPHNLRQKRAAANATIQPAKRMKVEHNVATRAQGRYFNETHIKNLPSSKEEVNVENVMKDVMNMRPQPRMRCNQNSFAYNHQQESYHTHNNQRLYTQNPTNPPQNLNRNNNMNKAYLDKPHIVPFEQRYLNIVQQEFSSLFDKTKANHVFVVRDVNKLKQILFKLKQNKHPPPYYQMPLAMNNMNNHSYILLQSSWNQLWIYGYTQFRQQMIEQLATAIGVNYGAFRHDVIQFGAQENNANNYRNNNNQYRHNMNTNYSNNYRNNMNSNNYRNNHNYRNRFANGNNVYNRNNLNINPILNRTKADPPNLPPPPPEYVMQNQTNPPSPPQAFGMEHGINNINDINVVDDLYINNEMNIDINEAVDIMQDSNDNTPIHVPSLQTETESVEHFKHAQISPQQSYVIPNEGKAVTKKKNTRCYPLVTPAFAPVNTQSHAMPLLNIMSQQNQDHDHDATRFVTDFMGGGDVLPDSDPIKEREIIIARLPAAATAMKQVKNVAAKLSLNDSMSMYVNHEVDNESIPKPMQIRQAEEQQKAYTQQHNKRRNRHNVNINGHNVVYNKYNKCNQDADKDNNVVYKKKKDTNVVYNNKKDEDENHERRDMNENKDKGENERDRKHGRAYNKHKDRKHEKRKERRNRKSEYYDYAKEEKHDKYAKKEKGRKEMDENKWRSRQYSDDSSSGESCRKYRDKYYRKKKRKYRKYRHRNSRKYRYSDDYSSYSSDDTMSEYSSRRRHKKRKYKSPKRYSSDYDSENEYHPRKKKRKTSRKKIKKEEKSRARKKRKLDNIKENQNDRISTKLIMTQSKQMKPTVINKTQQMELEEGELAVTATRKQNECKIEQDIPQLQENAPKHIAPKEIEAPQTISNHLNESIAPNTMHHNADEAIASSQTDINDTIIREEQKQTETGMKEYNNDDVMNALENEDDSSSDENLFDLVEKETNAETEACAVGILNATQIAQIGDLYNMLDPLLKAQAESRENKEEAPNMEVNDASSDEEPLFVDNLETNNQNDDDDELFTNQKAAATLNVTQQSNNTSTLILDVSKTPHMRPIGAGKYNSPFKSNILTIKKPQNARQMLNTKKAKLEAREIVTDKDNKENLLPPPPPTLDVMDDSILDDDNNNNNMDEDNFSDFLDADDTKLNVKNDENTKPKPLLFGGLNNSDSDSSDDSSEEDELLFAKELSAIQTTNQMNHSNLPNVRHSKNATNFKHFYRK